MSCWIELKFRVKLISLAMNRCFRWGISLALIGISLAQLQGDVCVRSAPTSMGVSEIFEVVLRVSPSIGVFAFKITEQVPNDVELLSVGQEGIWDESSRTIIWRRFSNGSTSFLNYRVRSASESSILNWQGSADFDGSIVEVTGTTQTSVIRTAPGITTRRLSSDLVAGETVEITLEAIPAPGTVFWTVQEEFTPGTLEFINAGGRLISPGRVRWGPFTSDHPAELIYRIQLPQTPGLLNMTGVGTYGLETVAVSGESSFQFKAPERARGERVVEPVYTPGDLFLVQLRLEIPSDPGLYALEEFIPVGWSVISTTPEANLVIDGAIRWGPLTESGSQTINYLLAIPDDSVGDRRFNGKVFLGGQEYEIKGTQSVSIKSAEPPSGFRFLDLNYSPGEPYLVRLEINPNADTGLYRVVEHVPSGWEFVESSDGGVFSAGTVSFGPYFDATPRILSYTLSPGANVESTAVFIGELQTVAGEIPIEGDTLANQSVPSSGSIVYTLPEEFLPGEMITLKIEVFPDTDSNFVVVEQFIPSGWSVVSANFPVNANDSERGRRVLWGPYTDNSPRLLELVIQAPSDAESDIELPLTAFFNGVAFTPDHTTIVRVNLPPQLPELLPLSFPENTPIELRLPVADPESSASDLLFEITWDNHQIFDESSQAVELDGSDYLLKLNPEPNRFGVTRFSVKLSDGVNQVEKVWLIEILEVNDPPLVTFPSEVLGLFEDSPIITMQGIKVIDPDADDGPIELQISLPEKSIWIEDSFDLPTGNVVWRLEGSKLVVNGSILFLNHWLGSLSWRPAPDLNGKVTLEFLADDQGFNGPGGAQVFRGNFDIYLTPVNDPPYFNNFEPDRVIKVWENSPAHQTVFKQFVQGISPGAVNENDQSLTSVIELSNSSLFKSLPVIHRNGDLSFQLKPDFFGESHVSFYFRDNGGTTSGGSDRSGSQEFHLIVEPVNRTPTATRGDYSDQIVVDTSGEDTIVIPEFVLNIQPGRPAEATQKVSVRLREQHPDWFLIAPAIDENGNLVFQTKKNIRGHCDIEWWLEDDGPGFFPHSNQSAMDVVTIVFQAPNSPPVLEPGDRIVVYPAETGPTAFASGIFPGDYEQDIDTIDINASEAWLFWMDSVSGVELQEKLTLENYAPVRSYPFPSLGTLEIKFPDKPENSTGLKARLSIADRFGLLTTLEVPVVYYATHDSAWVNNFPLTANWLDVDPLTQLPVWTVDEDSGTASLELESLFPLLGDEQDRIWTLKSWDPNSGLFRSFINNNTGEIEPAWNRNGASLVMLSLETHDAKVDWAFHYVVRSIEDGPWIGLVADQKAPEGEIWSLQLQGLAPDSPSSLVEFDLLDGPEGLVVESDGYAHWRPDEAQAPGRYEIVVRATQSNNLQQTEMSFFIYAIEVNQSPWLEIEHWISINEKSRWNTLFKLRDSDLPVSDLDLKLIQAPRGMILKRLDLDTAQLIWQPDESAGGQVFEVEIEISDDGSPSKSTLTAISIHVNELNDRPGFQSLVLSDQQLSIIPAAYANQVAGWLEMAEDQILDWKIPGVDPEGDSLTYRITEAPLHGNWDITGDDFHYTPNPDYNGMDQFKIVVSDGALWSEEYWVFLQVDPVPDVPVMREDVFVVSQGESFDFNAQSLLSNDSYPDGGPFEVSIVSDSLEMGILEKTGSHSWQYTAPDFFNGTEILSYRTWSNGFISYGRLKFVVRYPDGFADFPDGSLQLVGGRTYSFRSQDLIHEISQTSALNYIEGSLTSLAGWELSVDENETWSYLPSVAGGSDVLTLLVEDSSGTRHRLRSNVSSAVAPAEIHWVDAHLDSTDLMLKLTGAPGWNWILSSSSSVEGPWSILNEYVGPASGSEISVSVPFYKTEQSSSFYWKLDQSLPEMVETLELHLINKKAFAVAKGFPGERYEIYHSSNPLGPWSVWVRFEMNDTGLEKMDLTDKLGSYFLILETEWNF